MSHRLLTRTTGLAILLAIVLSVSLTAAPYSSLNTQLTGPLGALDLAATVDLMGSYFKYTYDLAYTSANVGPGEQPPQVHVFSVENMDDRAYTNATNSDGFTNPSYGQFWYEIKWIDGYLALGETVRFTYDSIYAPAEIPVHAYAVNGGAAAEGKTLGISSAAIPEPSSIAGLAMALVGVLPVLRKRR
ncbi:MAG: PEP-CTERM sorting domain-containing protein [Armatimonadetes bacterium]|nr:PEP-CTERM sorting domain-containing protein [Armatimonadota bacterium]